MMRTRRSLLLAALMLASASALSAQVPWETPQLTAPHAPEGVSVMTAWYAAAPGDGLGFILAWRSAAAPNGVGFRLAGGEGRGGETAVGGGIEAGGWIARANPAFPLDMIWTTGLGASYGRFVQIALPMGIAAGHSMGDAVWFNPYAAARVIVEGRVGGLAPDDELDLQIASELGANFAFDRQRKFILRVSAAMGDRSALAVGAHFGAGRVVKTARN